MNVMIDTNCINARQNNAAINQLEAWAQEDRIVILMCETSHRESYADRNKARFRKAILYPYSETLATTEEERRDFRDVEKILFPGGTISDNQRHDVDIVFNAMKYSNFLVTTDGGSKRQPGGILGNAAALKARFGLLAMTPEAAVTFLRPRI
jgi:hypothetical protein